MKTDCQTLLLLLLVTLSVSSILGQLVVYFVPAIVVTLAVSAILPNARFLVQIPLRSSSASHDLRLCFLPANVVLFMGFDFRSGSRLAFMLLRPLTVRVDRFDFPLTS